MNDLRPVFGMSKAAQEKLAAEIDRVKKPVVMRTPEIDGTTTKPIALELSAEARAHYTSLIVALYRKVTFRVGAYEKRFVSDMYSLISSDFTNWTLTAKQANLLDDLQWRYRRQLPREFNPEWDGKK
jgi:hypothetical protein